MCRLFGFRSVIPSQVHSSLVGAENALAQQSTAHPDGWGVAYYQGGCPHIVKSVQTAVHDHLFQQVSGVVSAETVVAHLRKATLGDMSIVDTHPFQFGRWVFAHNGNVKGFSKIKTQLVQEIAPVFRRFLLGNTDSEVFFLLIISYLSRHVDVHRQDIDVQHVIEAAKQAMEFICTHCEVKGDIDGCPQETYLSFVLTNGQTIVGHHGGQSLHWSTYKTRCSQRDTCPFLGPSCEAASPNGYINHLLISSEPLSGENIWLPLAYGDIVGVDRRMLLVTDRFDYGPYLNSQP